MATPLSRRPTPTPTVRPRAARADARQHDVPAGRPAQAVPHLHRRSKPSPAAAASSRNTSSASRSSARKTSFDPRTDPIVRVQARRLRAKLVRYYREEGRADESIIELPKGGYAPVFKQRDDADARQAVDQRRAGQPQHRRRAAVCRPQRRARPRLFLPAASATKSSITSRGSRTLRDSRVGRAARTGDKPARALIISGSVRRSGDRVRVDRAPRSTARAAAICGPSPSTRCSPTRSPPRSAWPTAIVKQLEPELRIGGAIRGARRPTENLAAHNLYLQGRYHLNQRTEEGLRKALDFFEKALVEDAQYAARAQRPRRRVRTAGALRRARTGRGVDQGRVERGDGGDARRPFGGGAHVARARQGDAGLGLARRRARVPARDQPQPALRDRASLVRDVVPRAARPARRGARRDARSRSRSIRCRRSSRAIWR